MFSQQHSSVSASTTGWGRKKFCALPLTECVVSSIPWTAQPSQQGMAAVPCSLTKQPSSCIAFSPCLHQLQIPQNWAQDSLSGTNACSQTELQQLRAKGSKPKGLAWKQKHHGALLSPHNPFGLGGDRVWPPPLSRAGLPPRAVLKRSP